jgi:hypothetical protein
MKKDWGNWLDKLSEDAHMLDAMRYQQAATTPSNDIHAPLMTMAELQKLELQKLATQLGMSGTQAVLVMSDKERDSLAIISLIIGIGPEMTKKLLNKLSIDCAYVDSLTKTVKEVLYGEENLDKVIAECVKEIKV